MTNDFKSIMVTGGAGFIGSHFVEMALKKNKKVIVLDALTYSGLTENLPKKNSNFEFIEGNILDESLVGELLRKFTPDAVVNFAAESHVDRAIDSPASFVKTNIEGTYRLLSATHYYWKILPETRRRDFRYLQISTDEVFGSLGRDGKFSEQSNFAPNSPYAASKAAADHLVRAWNHTYGFPTLITHCSNNFGTRQFPEKLIPHIILCALGEEKLPIYGEGSNVRDWIHVEDHCAGVFSALENGKLGASYCLGGNNEHTNLRLVKLICKILDQIRPRAAGKKYEELIHFVADRPGHDMRYAIDSSFAEKEIGFKSHPQKFEERLRQTIEWYLSNPDWCKTAVKKSGGKIKFDWKGYVAPQVHL